MAFMTKFDISKLPAGIQKLIAQLYKEKPKGVDIGPLQKDVFADLQERSAEYEIPELIAKKNDVKHLKSHRIVEPKPSKKMTPEEVGGMVNSIQNSSRSHVVTSKEKYPEAIVVPHGEYTYLGVLRPDDSGKVALQTAYPPKTKALPNKLGSAKNTQTTYKDWVDANLPSNYAPRSMGGREFTQRQLSAVEPSQASVEETVTTGSGGVKKIPLALLASSGLLSADTPEAAYMAVTGKPPSEGAQATWNPFESFLLGPLGMVGLGNKAAGIGLDMMLNALTE